MGNDYFNNLDRETLECILKSLPTKIFFKDLNGKYVFVSNNTDIDQDVIGKTSLDANINKDEGKISYDIDQRIIETGMSTSYEREINNNGINKYVIVTKNPVYKNGEMIGISGQVVDVTSFKELNIKLQELANTDALTKAYNRTYLDYWIETWNKEDLYPLTVFSVDCNDLKHINDTCGHSAGDEYLQKTAQVLGIQASNDSIVVRMGGDEFLVIYPNCDITRAIGYIESVKSMSNSIRIYNNPLSFAIGYNTVDSYTKYLNVNIDIADNAMYVNKSKMKKIGALR